MLLWGLSGTQQSDQAAAPSGLNGPMYLRGPFTGAAVHADRRRPNPGNSAAPTVGGLCRPFLEHRAPHLVAACSGPASAEGTPVAEVRIPQWRATRTLAAVDVVH